jgi:hypothetical protein
MVKIETGANRNTYVSATSEATTEDISANSTAKTSDFIKPKRSSDQHVHQMRRFAFEAEINCLPMYVKRSLDRLALKIGHSQWLLMTEQERLSIGQLSTATREDREFARRSIRNILNRYGTERFHFLSVSKV